ncbi:MAG: MotA/TolQ/ExbB proton channel family protein, partial [Oscillospiraceae bacterium]|nr:MotA/TolQ/ExbB proton channel family protein [Oscillospiraceae bacterium]
KEPEEIIELIHSVAVEVRKNGIISMEAKLDTIGDSFLAKGLKLLCDGNTEEKIREIMENEIASMEERHGTNASIFASAGMYAPTLGVLGAVFGLIAAMGHIDNTEMMSEAIAAAFIATILGIFTGYVLWNPFSTKLKVKSKEEVFIKQMIIVGVSEMAKGTNPMIIKEALVALLPEKEQAKASAKK